MHEIHVKDLLFLVYVILLCSFYCCCCCFMAFWLPATVAFSEFRVCLAPLTFRLWLWPVFALALSETRHAGSRFGFSLSYRVTHVTHVAYTSCGLSLWQAKRHKLSKWKLWAMYRANLLQERVTSCSSLFLRILEKVVNNKKEMKRFVMI